MLGIWVLIFAAPYSEALGIVPDDDGEDEQALDEFISILTIANKDPSEFFKKPIMPRLFSQDCANVCISLPHDAKIKSVSRRNASCVVPNFIDLLPVYRF
jgi:hypothetical protein